MFEISDDAMELILARLDAATEGRMDLREGTSQVGLRLNLRTGRAHLSLEPDIPDKAAYVSSRPLGVTPPIQCRQRAAESRRAN